jgi:hypothetical protein
MDMDGNQEANPMELSDNIVWHNPDKIFEPCQCMENSREEHSDLLQVLLPLKLYNILPKMDHVQLEDHGAVIFGHNVNFKWFWKDTGDPINAELPSSSEEFETQYYDSGIGSSLGSSATEGSGDLVGSISQQPLFERSSDERLFITQPEMHTFVHPITSTDTDATMAEPSPPQDREQFEIALIFALEKSLMLLKLSLTEIGEKRAENMEKPGVILTPILQVGSADITRFWHTCPL